MLRIDVRPSEEEEAGLRKRTRRRALWTDPDRGPSNDVSGVPSFCLWEVCEKDGSSSRGRWWWTTLAARSPLCRHRVQHTASSRSCIGEGGEGLLGDLAIGKGQEEGDACQMSCGSSQLPRLMAPCLQQAPDSQTPPPCLFQP